MQHILRDCKCQTNDAANLEFEWQADRFASDFQRGNTPSNVIKSNLFLTQNAKNDTATIMTYTGSLFLCSQGLVG